MLMTVARRWEKTAALEGLIIITTEFPSFSKREAAGRLTFVMVLSSMRSLSEFPYPLLLSINFAGSFHHSSLTRTIILSRYLLSIKKKNHEIEIVKSRPDQWYRKEVYPGK